jgi:hypothetical protein
MVWGMPSELKALVRKQMQQRFVAWLTQPRLLMLPFHLTLHCCPALLCTLCCVRALAGRSTQQQQQQQVLPSAELVSAAAAAVRPLVGLTESAVQLLPLALMRRCLQGSL